MAPERVADLVGHPRRQPADGGKLLGPDELGRRGLHLAVERFGARAGRALAGRDVTEGQAQQAQDGGPGGDVDPGSGGRHEPVGEREETGGQGGSLGANAGAEVIGVERHQRIEEQVEVALAPAREPNEEEDQPQIGRQGRQEDRASPLRPSGQNDQQSRFVNDESDQQGSQVDHRVERRRAQP
jgi:hypothetical protein